MFDLTATNDVQTMTSREIADLTGKLHKNVLRDIEVLSSVLSPASKSVTYRDVNNCRRAMWELSKRDTLILISGYNAELRARIIDRWEELENKQRQPAINLHDPKQLLGLLQNYAEENLKLQEKVEEAAPKVEFVGNYVDTTGLMTFREMCKFLSYTEAEVRSWLVENKHMYKLNGTWVFSAEWLKAKRGEHKVTFDRLKVARISAQFTPKGFVYISERISK